MSETEMTVSEIAYLLGYEQSSNFSTAFKKKFWGFAIGSAERTVKFLDQYYNMPDRLTLIKNIIFTIIGISLFTYILAVQLPLLKGQHGKTGRKYPAATSK